MIWRTSHRADPRAKALADRHYTRQTPDSPQFVKPGRCLVLLTECGRALWVAVNQRFVGHAWPGAWECALFRNEGAGLSSTLISDGVAATLAAWGGAPGQGLITFVNPDRIRPKANPGYCFLRAGFQAAGSTASGLICLQIAPAAMPAPRAAIGLQQVLFGGVHHHDVA